MDHYMIRQELNPETCKSDPETRFITIHDLHWGSWRLAMSIRQIIQINRRQVVIDNNPNNRKYYRRAWSKDSRKSQEVIRHNTDCGNREEIKILYIRVAGTSVLAGFPSLISQVHSSAVSRWWGTWRESSLAPCTRFKTLCTRFKKGEDRRKKKREVLHLFRCYTHTHTRPEPGQPWKARGRKKRTHEGQTAKNSAGGGGEQTDLRNQPTRRNGPDQNSAHT